MSQSRSQEEAARLQTQIGVSINLARQVVASWLPPHAETDAPEEPIRLKPRPAVRAGLGHLPSKTDDDGQSATLSLEELKLKRRLAQQTKARQAAQHEKESKITKKHARATQDSEDELDMRKGKGSSASSKSQSSYDAFTKKKHKRH